MNASQPIETSSMTNDSGESPARKRSFWPYGIVALLLCSMVADIYVCYIATTHPSLAAEANYYQKSLVWDKQVARERAFEKEGWSVKMDTLPVVEDEGKRDLQLRLQNDDGSLVAGAQLSLTMFQSRRPKNRLELELAEIAPGVYQTRVPYLKRGLWPYALTVLRGEGPEPEMLLHRGDFWVTR